MTPEALKRPEWPRPAASAAIFRGDTVLIVERGKGAMPGVWSLPGGHVEPGERAKETAAREINEETGLVVTIEGLVDVHDVIIRNRERVLTAHYVLSVFWGRCAEGTPVAATDVLQARFVSIGEVDSYHMTPGAQRIIREAFKRSQVEIG